MKHFYAQAFVNLFIELILHLRTLLSTLVSEMVPFSLLHYRVDGAGTCIAIHVARNIDVYVSL